jgi:hypothetical protein
MSQATSFGLGRREISAGSFRELLQHPKINSTQALRVARLWKTWESFLSRAAGQSVAVRDNEENPIREGLELVNYQLGMTGGY